MEIDDYQFPYHCGFLRALIFQDEVRLKSIFGDDLINRLEFVLDEIWMKTRMQNSHPRVSDETPLDKIDTRRQKWHRDIDKP